MPACGLAACLARGHWQRGLELSCNAAYTHTNTQCPCNAAHTISIHQPELSSVVPALRYFSASASQGAGMPAYGLAPCLARGLWQRGLELPCNAAHTLRSFNLPLKAHLQVWPGSSSSIVRSHVDDDPPLDGCQGVANAALQSARHAANPATLHAQHQYCNALKKGGAGKAACVAAKFEFREFWICHWV